MDFNAGSSVGRRWAELLAASGQLHGRHWAGSHGRRHVVFDISSDASLPAHFEGVNVSLDGGTVGGLPTSVHGNLLNHKWKVLDSKADAFVSWVAAGRSLSVTTRYAGEGVTFDVSEMRLYRDFVPEWCRW